MITESLKFAATVQTPVEGKVTLFVDAADGLYKMKLPDGSIVNIGNYEQNSSVLYIASDRLTAISLRDAGQLQAGAFYWLEDVSVLIQALSASTFAQTAKHLKSTGGQSMSYGLISTETLDQSSTVSAIRIADSREFAFTECLIEPVTISTDNLEAGATLIAAAINTTNCGWEAFAVKNAFVVRKQSFDQEYNNGSIVATTDGKSAISFVQVLGGREATYKWYDVVYDINTAVYIQELNSVELPGFFHEIFDPEYNVRVRASKSVFENSGQYFIESFPFGSPFFKNCDLKDITSMETMYVMGGANIRMVSDSSTFINTIIDATLNITARNAFVMSTLFIGGSQLNCDWLDTAFDNTAINATVISGSIKNSNVQNVIMINSNAIFNINNYEFVDHTMNGMTVSYIFDRIKGSISVNVGVNMTINSTLELGVLPGNALIYEMATIGQNMTTNNVGLFITAVDSYALIESIQFDTLASALKTISSGLSVVKQVDTSKIQLKDIEGNVTQGELCATFNFIKQ